MPTEQAFVEQMTKFSSETCVINATLTATHKFGPYLTGMPDNPMNGMATVKVVPNNAAAMPAPDNSTGWIYWPKTQEIIANDTRSDARGTPYAKY